MNSSLKLLFTALLLLLTSCIAPRTQRSEKSVLEGYRLQSTPRSPSSVSSNRSAFGADEVTAQSASTQRQDGGMPQLYGRDGTPVAKQTGGTITTDDRPVRDLQSADGNSRMYILELYQEAVNEKEALALEVQGLSAALDQAQAQLSEAGMLEQERGAYLVKLEEKIGVLEGQNVELAERLTTAQIRRLEAEKLLLEAKIEWQRVQDIIKIDTGGPGDPSGR
ncbi:MAG: hypothetical protein AAF368_15730 [Planctomycetota bacterium]